MVTTHANAEPTVNSAERGHRFVKSETVYVVADSSGTRRLIDCVFAFCRDTLSLHAKRKACSFNTADVSHHRPSNKSCILCDELNLFFKDKISRRRFD